MTAPCFGKKKRARTRSPSRAKTYAIARWPLLPDASNCGADGCARRTAANDASGTINCSLPVSTHSGAAVASRSPAERPSIDASCSRDAAGERCRGAFAVKRPGVAVGDDGNDARAHFQRQPIAGIRERAHDVRRAERRMARERHLERRRENAHVRGGRLRRQDERRLRQVELQRERLHRRVIEPLRILEYRERIAGERRFGEHVDDAKRVVASSMLLQAARGAAVRSSSCRASSRKAAGRASSTRNTAALR